ncbi:PIN domain-containing protein [Zobellia sp. B3R18]|uniref:PIN domain-containing protein n=1 Tax=Zobellia sp. B3R18 TaxID=2841568 RepID=UPI001C079D07|nr:PIN domain-containing protein [Zobellia sp. B3R18]MBU2974112.1 DUF4935 domain-containing protein [Zobellia sp. B3R18]
MNVFIDTNIYLNFYHYSSDELEELKKLIVLIEQKQINLLIPRQVFDEFMRNRETKISDALKRFKQERLNEAFPIFMKEYPEFESMKTAIKEYNNNKQILLKKIQLAIENYSLKADEITTEIFQKTTLISPNEKLISDAKIRFDLGNPPGKNNSYGDALNWETLLNMVDVSKDLVFISGDKDYLSEVDNTKFNRFLLNEWKTKKSSKIIFFKSISEFFRKYYPDIKLASELTKDLYIERLENSQSYKQARINLYYLSNFEDFTSEQLNRIYHAVIDNSQILWISQDEDINSILFGLIDKHKEIIDEIILTRFLGTIKRIIPKAT